MQLMDALKAVKANYSHLEDAETSKAWYEYLLTATFYKEAKAAADDDLTNMLIDSLRVYLEHGKKLPALSEAERAEKLAITSEYSKGLIEKGGISTDVFKKQLGYDVTKQFFDSVFFGTAK